MVTALGAERDVIRGLEAGADDYLTKPIRFPELIARIAAALRRARLSQAATWTRRSTFDGLRIEPETHRVTGDAGEVHLTPTEFRLLLSLARRPDVLVGHARPPARRVGADLRRGDAAPPGDDAQPPGEARRRLARPHVHRHGVRPGLPVPRRSADGPSATIAAPTGPRIPFEPSSARVPAKAAGHRSPTRDRHRRRRPQRRPARRREPRDHRLAVQAPRLHLPVVRDLRRHQRGVGLRAPRRGAEEQRQARLVEGDGPGPQRHRRPGRRDPHASPGVDHLRARRLVQRPARRVPRVPPPLPPRRAAGHRVADPDRPPRRDRHEAPQPGVPQRRDAAHAAPPLQPHVHEPHGAGRGRRQHRLLPPRDRPGLVRQLQERPAELAQEDPVRDRPDRQVVPQRDLARQLRVPDARVRADGDAVLRAARTPAPRRRSSSGSRGARRGTRRTA